MAMRYGDLIGLIFRKLNIKVYERFLAPKRVNSWLGFAVVRLLRVHHRDRI